MTIGCDDAASYSLGETAAKQKMVRFVRDKCGRRWQYRMTACLSNMIRTLRCRICAMSWSNARIDGT